MSRSDILSLDPKDFIIKLFTDEIPVNDDSVKDIVNSKPEFKDIIVTVINKYNEES